jgi:glycosyltransferase involved in cell wall biosynthesis
VQSAREGQRRRRYLGGIRVGTVKRKAPNRYDVAFYVPWIGPLLTDASVLPTGGAETQIFLLARALARRGSKVCLLVFALPGAAIPSSIDDVDVSVRPPYRAHARFGKLRELINTWRTVSAADADVIVTRTAGPHVGLVGVFTKLARRRFVYSSASPSDFDFRRLPKRVNRALFGLGIRVADEIVVQTEEQVRLCMERFSRSSVLIKSLAEPAPRRRHEPEAFLWIGRLVDYKRPLAFVDLARALPEAKFWLVSVPVAFTHEGQDLRRTLERSAVEAPNLELLPPRPRPVLMDLIDRAVAVVNTSDFEGMPNIFLEGWARGVPALALMGDPDGVIERFGLGAFAHRSTQRLLELARQLWERRMHQDDVASRCRQYIFEHHSPDSVSADWQAVLHGVTVDRHRSRGSWIVPASRNSAD